MPPFARVLNYRRVVGVSYIFFLLVGRLIVKTYLIIIKMSIKEGCEYKDETLKSIGTVSLLLPAMGANILFIILVIAVSLFGY